jgi:beta-exotoxin I transport system permease protein
VIFVNSATAAEEDAGQIELFVAEPIKRRSFFAGRTAAVLLWLVVLAIVTLVWQLASDVLFGLEIGTDRIVATIALCALLGLCYAGLALAIAGFVARPGSCSGSGLARRSSAT